MTEPYIGEPHRDVLHRLLWAKSAKKDKETGTLGVWKPVLAHLLDVAACAWEVLLLEPEGTLNLYARDLGYPETPEGREAATRWICALIALHDLGKASPAFEQQWAEWPEKGAAAEVGLSWSTGLGPDPKEVVSHSLISHATLPKLLEAHGWDGEVARQLADAVGAHHGFRAKPSELTRARAPKEQGRGAWEQARQELYDVVCQTLEVPDPPPVQRFSGGPYMRLAGLTSFADWIGSSFELERFEQAQLDTPATYFGLARGLAREKLTDIHWEPRHPLSEEAQDFADVFGYLVKEGQTFQPRPLQHAVQELLSEVSAPTLLLVEAPMGEGKTELALYAHLTLQRQLGHRGLYIALPTQATGNAMFARVAEFLQKVGGGRPLDLQLLHGGKDLNRDFAALRVQPNTAPDADPAAQSPQEEMAGRSEAQRSVTAREWFTVRKRALLSEYGVGTVDQALLGVLPVAHQFIRLWGLGNRTVVLDEVHAYDMYTGHLIEELVRWLHALGSSVILMSATLPSARREALLRAYGAKDAPPADYPRLTRVSGGEVSAVTVEADPSRNKSIRVQGLPETLEAVAARTLELHARGGITAVIVNTVQRAQDLRRALKDAGVPAEEVLLFHARARNKDRRSREERVLAQLGKDGKRPQRLILLGSQVLEQSLDYDADVMLSDLAPLDLVLQRAGRLHRHARDAGTRAGHEQPVLHIAGLTPQAVPDLKGTAWQYIYQPWALLRAWTILKDRPTIELPGQLDALVQRAYRQADPEGLSSGLLTRLAEALTRKATEDAGQTTLATLGAIVPPDIFPDGGVKDPRWDDDPGSNDDEVGEDEERPTAGTRLGDESVTVVPLFRQEGGLYLDPGGEKAPLSSRDFGKAGPAQTALVAALHECSVRLSRFQVVNGLKAHAHAHVPGKLHWPKVPALRDALPLVLDEQDGRWVADVNGLRVGYDFELGVVYG